MNSYTNPGTARNHEDHLAYAPPVPDHRDLTPGGAIIWQRTRRPISTCNLLARIAGLGPVEV